jgi:hypothetical protein
MNEVFLKHDLGSYSLATLSHASGADPDVNNDAGFPRQASSEEF